MVSDKMRYQYKNMLYRLIAKLVMAVNGDLKDMDLVKFFVSFMG